MRVRLFNATNSIKCPKCGKLMQSYWFGDRCKKCNYEQLNQAGKEFKESMRKVEK